MDDEMRFHLEMETRWLMTEKQMSEDEARLTATPSGRSYGKGDSSTAFTTPNNVVFAPMPRASVSAATAVNPGRRRSVRTANRAS